MKLILILASMQTSKIDVFGVSMPRRNRNELLKFVSFLAFFFENEQGEAVTVNGDPYRAMLTKIEEEDIGNIWFQQDVPHNRSYTRCV